MRIKAINTYFWRRYTFGVGIWLAVNFVMIIVVALSMMTFTRSTSVQLGRGNVEMVQSYEGMRAFDDASMLTSDISYVGLLPILALMLIKRDRHFLVAMSAARYEILVGSLAFLFTMAAALTLAGSIIIPAASNLILWGLGFNIRGGWNAFTVLTGGHSDWWRTMLLNLFDMIQLAGIATFIGYIMLRWWKPILITGAALVIAAILVVTQLYMNVYVQKLAEFLISFIEKFVTDILPAWQQYLSQTNLFLIAVQKIAVGVGLVALCYPIMRRMKVS